MIFVHPVRLHKPIHLLVLVPDVQKVMVSILDPKAGIPNHVFISSLHSLHVMTA